MPDLLIRNVDEETVRLIDARAQSLGLSRAEFLRREVQRAAQFTVQKVTMEDLRRSAEICADVLDEEIMAKAWS